MKTSSHSFAASSRRRIQPSRAAAECVFRALLSLAVIGGCARYSAAGAPAPVRPNIVIIMSDDMGFSDLGCYGGEIWTPQLDRLAQGGLRFKQFYNTARCCPTRASLLTGLYPHQAGIGHMMDDRGHEGYRGELNRRSVTIPEALRPAGYRTYAVGKWHVTKATAPKSEAEKHNWPLQRGFDRYYGTIHGAGSFWDPSSLVRDNKLITAFNDSEYQPSEPFYYTDAISDQAVRFIRDHARDYQPQPYFLYVSYTAAHWPMHARDRDIALYDGYYDGGYERVRHARLAKAKALGLIDRALELSPPPGSWERVKDLEFETRCMEVYAAMITSMDAGIGRIVDELRAQDQFDNTLLFFLQDNGGCAETVGRGAKSSARAAGPTLEPLGPDFLQQGSVPKQTRSGWPVRQGYGVMPGPDDTYIAYGRDWANVSNTPFREYKHWVHEGGISSPLIVHWPAGVPAQRRGKLVNDPGHLIDLMATCIDVSGAPYPAEFAGHRIQPLEGVSLRPLFEGKRWNRPNPIFWEHEGNRAIRSGRWKLVAKEKGDWELYDIERDRTELVNLAARYPERVHQLAAQWESWAERCQVLPLGAWRATR